MSKKWWSMLAVLMVFTLIISACAPAAAPAPTKAPLQPAAPEPTKAPAAGGFQIPEVQAG